MRTALPVFPGTTPSHALSLPGAPCFRAYLKAASRSSDVQDDPPFLIRELAGLDFVDGVEGEGFS